MTENETPQSSSKRRLIRSKNRTRLRLHGDSPQNLRGANRSERFVRCFSYNVSAANPDASDKF